MRPSATRSRRYSTEIVLVDDGSTDDTLQVARTLIEIEPRLRVIELRRNFGQTAALQAGLSCATGEFVISMDSDLQHFPEDIPLFIEQAERGFDVVCGWRKDRQENALRRWPSRAANILIKRVIGVDLHDFGTTFRLYRADLLSHINLIGEEHRFVPALAHMVGARITEIPIKNIERPVGTSNYGIGRTFGVALDILFLYFSRFYATRPLRVFGKVAVVLLLPGIVIAAALLAINVLTGEPTTRTQERLVSVVGPADAVVAAGPADRHPRRGAGAHFLPHRQRREFRRAPRVERRGHHRAPLMCGIVGHFAGDGGAMASSTLFELVHCVAHRGPDDSTFWQDGPFSFGHRRLSIIDLASGRQPMASADGAIVITYNGEIYNYLELRAELTALGHAFRTQSDTEVLINGYRQWGIDLLPKLLGMFAFAIADRPKRELLLARDRFGEKPLLYLDDRRGTTFASELTPLSRIAQSREIDADALGRYLTLNYVPGEQTLLKGVRRVPPGGWRRYRADGRVDEGIYWSPPTDVDRGIAVI